MQYMTRKKFGARMSVTALILCVFLQLICAVTEYICVYRTGNAALGNTVYILLEALRTASVFSSYAIITYTVFLGGLDGGGEWLLCEISGCALLTVLIFSAADFTLGLILSALMVIVLASILFCQLRMFRGVYAVILTALAVPFLGGITLLYAVPNTTPETSELFSALLYGMLDRCVNLLLITAAARAAASIRRKTLERNGGMSDISISGFLPLKNPLLKALFAADIIFFLTAAVQTAIEVYYAKISPYGMPEDASEWLDIASDFAVPAVYLVLGYVIMWVVARLCEALFVKSENETAAISRR